MEPAMPQNTQMRVWVDQAFPHHVPSRWKLVSAVLTFAALATWVAYRMERNASPFFR